MLGPAALLRVFTELVLAMLGLLLVQVAIAGRFSWDPRSPMWLALGLFLIYWGVHAWMRASHLGPQWEERLRGASLALVGAVMVGIAQAPYAWVAPLLGGAGGILTVRGLVSILVILRSR